MRFIIFVIDSHSNTANGDEISATDAFNVDLQANGHWIMAAGIAGPDKAKLIDNRSALGVMSSASLNTGSEHYSGFWIIEANSQDTAISLAEAGSKACNRKVELRPFLQ